jgi:soluble lytic murein transglycosylase-like protein
MSIGNIIHNTSLDYGIRPELIAAVIYQESRGNPWAIRYEPAFYKKYLLGKQKKDLQGYVPSIVSLDTELTARAISWGLMQLMGETAREYDFNEDYLPMLLDTSLNIQYGVKVLSSMLKKTDSLEAGLLKWNGGGNKNYPNEVLSWLNTGKSAYLLA